MTAREVFEGMLIELSKVHAPSMLLSEFNYYFNKAVNQYINKRYNIYDVNQQTTDDVRVLKSEAILIPVKSYGDGATLASTKNNDATSYLSQAHNSISSLYGATYDKGSYVQFPAKKLTADSWSQIINDFYNRPLPERPYYYIHNVNKQNTLPTHSESSTVLNEDPLDMNGKYKVTSYDGKAENDKSNFPRTVKLNGVEESVVEKNAAVRIGNPSTVRMEIRYGKDDSIFELKQIYVDYIKIPQYIRLTQEQLDLTEDTSQIMEFPDNVCQEIINELVHLVMSATADPLLQSHVAVTQSIANPAQALAQPAAQAAQ